VDELVKQVDDLLDSDSDQPEQLHYQGLVKYIDELDDIQKEIVEDILKKSKNKEDQNRNYLTNTSQKRYHTRIITFMQFLTISVLYIVIKGRPNITKAMGVNR